MWKVKSGKVERTASTMLRSQPGRNFNLIRGKPASTAPWIFSINMSRESWPPQSAPTPTRSRVLHAHEAGLRVELVAVRGARVEGERELQRVDGEGVDLLVPAVVVRVRTKGERSRGAVRGGSGTMAATRRSYSWLPRASISSW